MKNWDLFEVLKFAKLFVKSEKKVRNETLKKLCSRVFFQAARIAFLLDEIFMNNCSVVCKRMCADPVLSLNLSFGKKFLEKQRMLPQLKAPLLLMLMLKCWCHLLSDCFLKNITWIPGSFKQQVQKAGFWRVTCSDMWHREGSPLQNQTRKLLLLRSCLQNPLLHLRHQWQVQVYKLELQKLSNYL